MPPKKPPKEGREPLERDRGGNLFVDIPGGPGENKVRISVRRSWYSPPYDDDGEVDLERAAEELSAEVTGGTLVIRRYLENGDLGYATELPLDSEDELEQVLLAMRTLYAESLQYDNATRLAGLEACAAAIVRNEQRAELAKERRQDMERRMMRRRGRPLLGFAWFRRDDRRAEPERRVGLDRRTAQGRISNPHQQSAARQRRSSGGSTLAGGSP